MERNSRKIKPSNQHEQSSLELAETKSTCTGPARVCTRLSVEIYGFQFSIFMGFPGVRRNGSLIWGPSLGLSYSTSM